jgi:tetratricopeptide (TPR) repeat protein
MTEQVWDLARPYLQVLAGVEKRKLLTTYLNLRKHYGASPAFYLDVADYLLEKNQRRLAVRVLSNIVELKLENAALLRIAAYRLMDIKAYDLAIPLFAEVKRMRPEEPQSARDLALAHGARARKRGRAHDYQRALALLKEVVTGEWGRFEEIRGVALTELNNLLFHAQRAGVGIEATGLDPILLRNLELDVRIVLSWDADNTEVELQVVEPGGATTSDFDGSDTPIVGRTFNRYTEGYGPETYCLRRAPKGEYGIHAFYDGSTQARRATPVVVRVEVITDYGRRTERRRSITRRLEQEGDTLDLGSLVRE